MRRIMVHVALASAILLGAVCAAQAVTQEDAKALVEKAAAYVRANGKDKALAEFNNPKGQFTKGDLYIFATNWEGVQLANGGNPKLVGFRPADLGLKDANGKYFVNEMIEMAKTKGSGWVNYTWTNPTTKKVQPKAAWVQRIEGADWFIGCGIFKGIR